MHQAQVPCVLFLPISHWFSGFRQFISMSSSSLLCWDFSWSLVWAEKLEGVMGLEKYQNDLEASSASVDYCWRLQWFIFPLRARTGHDSIRKPTLTVLKTTRTSGKKGPWKRNQTEVWFECWGVQWGCLRDKILLRPSLRWSHKLSSASEVNCSGNFTLSNQFSPKYFFL